MTVSLVRFAGNSIACGNKLSSKNYEITTPKITTLKTIVNLLQSIVVTVGNPLRFSLLRKQCLNLRRRSFDFKDYLAGRVRFPNYCTDIGQYWQLGCFILFFAGALSGCAISPPGPEPDTLRFNIAAEPPSLDWHVCTDSTSFDVISNLMVGLTQYRNDLSCAPACAENWEIRDNGKQYIFHLRRDVLWTDGVALTAHDFEYAWKRLLNPATGGAYAYFFYDIVNAFEYNTGKIKDAKLVGIKALDDVTLEVRLKKPAAYFIYLTAFCPSYPQRRDIVEEWGSRWTEPEHMVVNGPFKVAGWQHEYKIELVANEHFFEGVPALKRIKMFMIPEQATAFALYENSQLDFVDNRSFPTADVFRYKNSPQYKNFPLLRNNYIGFNVKKAPFTDKRVRQAVSMAIDRNIFPIILRRGERPSSTWIPPGIQGHDDNSGLPFNPSKARALLAQAGYPNGEGLPPISLLYPTREDARLVVEAIQDQLKTNLGMKIQLENQEWKMYLATLKQNPPPMYRNSWGADYPDPETFANIFVSHNGNNDTNWGSPIYDDLVERGEGEQNPETRAELYRQADKLLCSDAVPLTCTYLSTQNLCIKPWVKGLECNPLDLQFFKSVTIDPAGK